MENKAVKGKKKGIVLRRKQKGRINIDTNLVSEYVNSNDLSIEEINTFIKHLIAQYEKEKETRSRFQLERDKLIEMRDIEQKRVDDIKTELLEAREQMSKLEQEHYQEISILKQKVRYLMSEHQLKINNLKIEIEKLNKENIDENLKEKEKHSLQLKQFLITLNDKEDHYENMITKLQLEFDKRKSQMTHEHAEKLKAIELTMESRFNDERTQFSLLTRNAVHEICELKNTQINELIKINNKAYDDLRNYFKDLINNAMILVSNLQEKIHKTVLSEKEYNSKIKHLENDIKCLNDDNSKLRNENSILNQKCEIHEKEKKLFHSEDIKYNKLKKEYKCLDIKYEMLKDNYNKLELNHNNLVDNINVSSLIYQEKCNNRIFISNKKIELLQKDLNKYEDFLKAFSIDINFIEKFDNNQTCVKYLIDNNKMFNFYEILKQFRIRDDAIDDLNKRLIEVILKYNRLVGMVQYSIDNNVKLSTANFDLKFINIDPLYANLNLSTSPC